MGLTCNKWTDLGNSLCRTAPAARFAPTAREKKHCKRNKYKYRFKKEKMKRQTNEYVRIHRHTNGYMELCLHINTILLEPLKLWCHVAKGQKSAG